MSATELLEQIRRLPREEQCEIVETLQHELGGAEDDLTPEEIAELDRRAESALKNPGRGTPIGQVSAEIKKRILARK